MISGNLPIHCRDGEVGFYAPSSSSVAASILYGLDEESRKNTVFIGIPNPEGMPPYKTVQETDCTFVPVNTSKRPKDLVFTQHLSQSCHHALGKSALFPEDLEKPYKDYLEFNQKFADAFREVYTQNDRVIIIGKHLLMLPMLIRKEFSLIKISLVFICPFPPYELFTCIPYSKEVLQSILACDRVELQSIEYLENFISTAFLSVNAQNKEVSPHEIESILGNASVSYVDKDKKDSKEDGHPLIPHITKKESVLSIIAESYCVDSLGLGGVKEQPLDLSSAQGIQAVCSSSLNEYLEDVLPVAKSLQKPLDRNKAYIVYTENTRVLARVSPCTAPSSFIEKITEMKEFAEVKSKLEDAKKGRKIVLLVETTRKIGAPLNNLLSVLTYLKKDTDNETDFIRCVVYGESAAYHNTELAGLSEKISSLFPTRFTTVIFPSVYLYFSLLALSSVCVAGSPTDSVSLVASEYLAVNPQGTVVAPYSSGISYKNALYTLNCPEVTAHVIEDALKKEGEKEKIMSTQRWVETLGCTLRTDLPSGEEPLDKKAVHTSRDVFSAREAIKKGYQDSEKRMIFLDYDGTMTEIVPNPRDAKPTEEILSILRKLQEDPKNNVFIVTGRSKEESEEWFGSIGLTIYAEHGAYKKEGTAWAKVPCDLTWMPDAIKIIEEYVSYTPGTNIEIKNTCVVFHCGEYGKWCASALQRILGNRARVVTGKNIIEVRPKGIDKGSCIEKEAVYNCFTLCAGDDATDEDMFMVLLESQKTYTICVGERNTCAAYRANTPEDLRGLLKHLYE